MLATCSFNLQSCMCLSLRNILRKKLAAAFNSFFTVTLSNNKRSQPRLTSQVGSTDSLVKPNTPKGVISFRVSVFIYSSS